MPERNVRPESRTPKRAAFDYTLDFTATDFRQRPDLYRVGKGEQGVLLVEPYKSEILLHSSNASRSCSGNRLLVTFLWHLSLQYLQVRL